MSTEFVLSTGLERKSDDRVIQELKGLVYHLAWILKEEGLSVQPCRRENDFNRFLTFSPEHRNSSLVRLKRYVDVCEMTRKQGHSLANHHAFLWNMLKEMGYVPHSEMFGVLEDQDIVEIYDNSLIQVFRNLRFFEICSYSLVELLTYEFPELYYREDSITQRLLKQVFSLLNEEQFKVLKADAPLHRVQETFSDHKNEYFIRQKYIAPLRDRVSRSIAIVGTFEVVTPDQMGIG